MKIRTLSVALAIVILSACARTTDTDAPMVTEILTPITDRAAMTVEVENDVQAAIDLDMTFRPAFPGLLIPPGARYAAGWMGVPA
jgi:hypothetical protein